MTRYTVELWLMAEPSQAGGWGVPDAILTVRARDEYRAEMAACKRARRIARDNGEKNCAIAFGDSYVMEVSK